MNKRRRYIAKRRRLERRRAVEFFNSVINSFRGPRKHMKMAFIGTFSQGMPNA